jgi:hypothetical protein
MADPRLLDPPELFFEHSTGAHWIRLVNVRGTLMAELSSPGSKDAMGVQQWTKTRLDDHAQLLAAALLERLPPFEGFSRKEWDAGKQDAAHWKARAEYLMGVIKVAEEKDKVEKGHLQAEISRLTSALAESQANVQRLEQEREDEAHTRRRKKAG